MKVYVTGGSKGLGKALVESLQDEMGRVTDLSRTTGYDLSKDLEAFVKDDFDVYINNAQYGFQQTELLYRLFEENKYRDCHIINIGSVSGDGDRKEVNKYAVEKAALEKATVQLQLVKSECHVSLVKLGRMETEMVSHIYAPKMNVRGVARNIRESVVLSRGFGGQYVKSITIDNV